MLKHEPYRTWQALIIAVLWALLCANPQKLLAQAEPIDVQLLDGTKVLNLKGPWDFFWAEWVEPGNLKLATQQQLVGRSWTPGDNSSFKKGQGYATYRLELQHVQPLKDGYSLAIRSASTALKLMIYPKQHPEKVRTATAGRIGTNQDEEIPQLRLTSLRFFPEADETEWVMLVQVSNFRYGRGGLWNAPVLGKGSEAENHLYRDREFLLFCIGMIMVIGVYNSVLFARRPTDKATLMLAIFCAVVSVRSFVTDNFLSWYFPAVDLRLYELKYLLEYTTMLAGPLACVSFVHQSFLASSLPRFYRIIKILSLIGGLVIIGCDTYQRSLIIIPFQVLTLMQVVFGLTVLVRAVLDRREEAWLSATGGFMLGSCVVYDVLVTFNVFPQPYISSLGMSAFVFMQSQVVANRFAKAFGIAEHLSRKLKDEVDRQTLELRSIMENIPQGVFIMLADQTIQGNYSKELEQLLDQPQLTGKNALPVLFHKALLSDEDLSIVDSILVTAFHEPILAWELNAHGLPQEFRRREDNGIEQTFEVEWHPILDRQERVDRVLVTVRNVTEFRVLQASQRKDQQAFTLLLEIVQIPPARFRDFMMQSWDILRQAESESRNEKIEASLRLRKVLMRLHTWKGLSRSLGFKALTARIHEGEQVVTRLDAHDPEALETLRSHIQELMDKLLAYESIEKERLGRSDEVVYSAESSPEYKRLLEAWSRHHYQPMETYRDEVYRALGQYINSLPGVTTGQLVKSIRQELPGLAQVLCKPLPILEAKGSLQRPLPENLFKSMSYILQHLIRNSMDHGLESNTERLQKGKSAQGRISVRFDVQDGCFVMEYSDDGRGLDLDMVLKKARSQGLATAAEAQSPREVAQLIFAPGFSTKNEVNTISGRGIGMDAVRLLVEETGGEITLLLSDEHDLQPAFHLRARWALVELIAQVA